jgi:hypothetical protein
MLPPTRLTAGAGLRLRRSNSRAAVTLGLAAASLSLTGCALPWGSTPTANTPTVVTTELMDADGRPCPKELPVGDDPSGHGFGTESAAERLPSLLEPQQAWVCRYDTFEEDATSAGVVYEWRLAGRPAPLAADDITALRSALDRLDVADRGGPCTADLGPRWMVVYSHDGDFTGVVVDDYGCRDIRLTDNPHTTPPGSQDQGGTVGGVFAGGTEILDIIGVGRAN